MTSNRGKNYAELENSATFITSYIMAHIEYTDIYILYDFTSEMNFNK